MTPSNNPSPRPPDAARKSQGRSRVANGKLHRRGVDRRSHAARRFKDAIDALCAEIGAGYADLPESRRALVRTAAAAIVRLEEFQAALAAGQATDPDQLVRLGNLLARTLTDLGLSSASERPDPRAGLPTDADLIARGVVLRKP